MNEIAQKATADKFLSATKKEGLSKKEAVACIGLIPVQVSYLFNEKYWSRLGNTYWNVVLAWVNSGQSLREYSEKHRKVLVEKEPSEPKTKEEGQISKEAWEANKPKEVKLKSPFSGTPKEQTPARATKGELIDMLIAEKELLKIKIDAIDTLLKHYIS